MLLFASEIRGLLELGPDLFRGHARRGYRCGEDLLPTSTAAPSPSVPLPIPIWGPPCCLGAAGLFLLPGAAGCPAPSAAPEDSWAGIKGGFPVLSALDAQPTAAGGADFIPERLRCGQRRVEGGGRRGGGGGGGVRAGGAQRDQGKLNTPSTGFITSQPPAKVRNAHLETG